MPADPPSPPADRVPAAAWALGPRREAEQSPADRTGSGAWFTPQHLARHLAALADPLVPPTSVLDPACGGGAFLLAAIERWPDSVVHGIDMDPVTADVARTALRLLDRDTDTVTTGDGLLTQVSPADLVLGNPPFLSQLSRRTARDAGRRETLTARYGVLRYTDEAALFVLRTATELLNPAGTAVLVVPEALLATEDCREVRRAVAERCSVEVVWRDTTRVFPGTPTCAIRLRRDALTAPTHGSWAHLLADEVPSVTVDAHRRVGDVATATADFRDAYYRLAAHVREHQDGVDGPPIVPVGLIDPAHLRWGRTDVRFAKRRWRRPVAVGLPQPFLDRRLGPKVLVATQTKVLEALVDDDGRLLPSTPTITVRTDRPWHVAAALTSPVATAVAARRHAGAARTRGALKLSAKQVLALPVPEEGEAWDAAAETIRLAHATDDADQRRALILRCGQLVDEAHGLHDAALTAWWADRLPRR